MEFFAGVYFISLIAGMVCGMLLGMFVAKK